MIYLSQWLCPSRHASLGYVWDSTEQSAGEVEAAGERVFLDGPLERRCGICGEGLAVEHAVTLFPTVAEARRNAERVSAEQIRDRLRLDALGLTEDEKRRRRIERSN